DRLWGKFLTQGLSQNAAKGIPGIGQGRVSRLSAIKTHSSEPARSAKRGEYLGRKGTPVALASMGLV
ncbi:MAG: hypothetical protein LBF38_08805, partial [Deltaproteobacteria bacterium]|nr:hypothetical protein [Deltaproteobacteria bacterium]